MARTTFAVLCVERSGSHDCRTTLRAMAWRCDTRNVRWPQMRVREKDRELEAMTRLRDRLQGDYDRQVQVRKQSVGAGGIERM